MLLRYSKYQVGRYYGTVRYVTSTFLWSSTLSLFTLFYREIRAHVQLLQMWAGEREYRYYCTSTLPRGGHHYGTRYRSTVQNRTQSRHFTSVVSKYF